MKFHVNPSTGGISRCKAESTPCPFGGASGTENHYGSIAEAKVGYEELMKVSLFPSHSKEAQGPDPTPPPLEEEDSPELAEAREVLKVATRDWRKLDAKLKALEKKPNFKFTKSWYEQVQERKAAFYAMGEAHRSRHNAFPEEERLRREEEARVEKEADAARFEAWKARKEAENGPYNFHPPLEGAEAVEAKNVISSFSGLSQEEVAARVAAAEAEGLSPTEAHRKVWEEVPLRTDKPLVMIDLEVASPMVRNRVDVGPYSSIIEVGYVKRYPDGRIEENSYLCGVPDSLMATEGTGAEHIHNISPAMVTGLRPFTEDGEKQRELLATLEGSVLVAHNASYEVSQFSHNLPRFNSALDQGRVEVLDTRSLVKCFMPETAANSNKDFVEATGSEYTGAHRALADAKMTLEALLRSKGMEA